jgi:hypothetical protein
MPLQLINSGLVRISADGVFQRDDLRQALNEQDARGEVGRAATKEPMPPDFDDARKGHILRPLALSRVDARFRIWQPASILLTERPRFAGAARSTGVCIDDAARLAHWSFGSMAPARQAAGRSRLSGFGSLLVSRGDYFCRLDD